MKKIILLIMLLLSVSILSGCVEEEYKEYEEPRLAFRQTIIDYHFEVPDNVSTGQELSVNYTIYAVDLERHSWGYTTDFVITANSTKKRCWAKEFRVSSHKPSISGILGIPTYEWSPGNYTIRIKMVNGSNRYLYFEIINNESSPPFKTYRHFYVVDHVTVKDNKLVVTAKKEDKRYVYDLEIIDCYVNGVTFKEDIYNLFKNNTNNLIKIESIWSKDLHNRTRTMTVLKKPITGFLIDVEKSMKAIYSYRRVYSEGGSELDWGRKEYGKRPYYYDVVKDKKIGEELVGVYLYFKDRNSIYINKPAEKIWRVPEDDEARELYHDKITNAYSFSEFINVAEWYVNQTIRMWYWQGRIYYMEEI